LVSTKASGDDTGTPVVDEGADPAARPSAMQLLADPVVFPEDGPVSAKLRQIDRYAGLAEQILLFGTLIIVVLTGAAQAISTKVFGKSLLW
jgi:hypothetical protein